MEILVFKTNVLTEEHVGRVQRILNTLGGVSAWNFDLEDCDKILRVVTDKEISAQKVEELLSHAGIYCRELF